MLSIVPMDLKVIEHVDLKIVEGRRYFSLTSKYLIDY